MASEMGDPAPIGLLSFAITTALLMYVDMGWVEGEFKEMVWGYATWYGGAAQLIAGFFELVKGNTFGATAFVSYGGYWLGWAQMYGAYKEGTLGGPEHFETGEGFRYASFGILTTGFWVITLRKNICLCTVFGLLSITFYLLAMAMWSGEEVVTRLGGYCGLATALAAFYTAFAELFAHEWGFHVLPGLQPLRRVDRTISKGCVDKRVTYDPRTKTLLVDLHELEVRSEGDIEEIQSAIAGRAREVGEKVHAVVNYHGFTVLPQLVGQYQQMAAALQRDYYLSTRRCHTDLFGARELPSCATPHTTAELEALVHQLQRENAMLLAEQQAAGGQGQQRMRVAAQEGNSGGNQ